MSGVINNNTTFQNNELIGGRFKTTDEMYNYKAFKYHMKIQDKLKREYVGKGLPIPSGYEEYLGPYKSQ